MTEGEPVPDGELEAAGGVPYLASLMDGTARVSERGPVREVSPR